MENYNRDKATEGNGVMLRVQVVGRSDLRRGGQGGFTKALAGWLRQLECSPTQQKVWVRSLLGVGIAGNR